MADAMTNRYSEERVARWVAGEISLAELDGMSPTDLQQIAFAGNMLRKIGQLDDAAIIFRGLIAMAPRQSAFHAALGSVSLAKRDLDDAGVRLDEAVKLDPKDGEALALRGELKTLRGQHKEAIIDLNRAIDLSGGRETAWVRRAKGLVATAQKAR